MARRGARGGAGADSGSDTVPGAVPGTQAGRVPGHVAGPILVLNAGSSSIKAALFAPDLTERARVMAEGIGAAPGAGRLRLGAESRTAEFDSHAAALDAVLAALAAAGHGLAGLAAAAHRVVHGGSALTRAVRIDAATRDAIARCTPLAPLHNPHNLAAIDLLARRAPDLPQVAAFDTAFHATNPELATRYAVPERIAARGIRRYGFHGLSYAALVDNLPAISAAPLPRRLLAFHLGHGASICAILEGRSVATTMGYSPLEGLPMSTRCGSIDAAAVLRLAAEDGIDATRDVLLRESGLKGLSGGIAEMRALLADDSPQSRFAVAHFCYWAVRHAGSLIAAMGGLDAIAFTGGIGENAAPVRARIVAGLGWLGARLEADANARGQARLHPPGCSVGCWIVPAAEERRIAAEALALLADTRRDPTAREHGRQQ
ncbi:MAG: acetate kinase [Roseovarius sp.]